MSYSARHGGSSHGGGHSSHHPHGGHPGGNPAKRRYGALRGKIVATGEERNDTQSPHYQIMVVADGQPWRVAVNVKSTDRGKAADSSFVLYRVVEDFRHPMLETLKAFEDGFSPIAAGAENDGLDYIRGNLFDPKDLRLLPPDEPGDGNDLNDVIDAHIERVKDDPDAVLFAFGQPWGPEDSPDKTFHFKPNRGVHDIHMNQGNPIAGGHAGDNGVWQDGGLLLWFPKADRWVAVFLAFQSQSWHTDDHTGNPIEGRTGAEAAGFDAQNRPLIAAEQTHPAIEIIAARVKELAHEPPAVLLLNMGGDDVDLSGWSLMATRNATKSLTGTLTGGHALAVEVPAKFFEDRGGVVSCSARPGSKSTVLPIRQRREPGSVGPGSPSWYARTDTCSGRRDRAACRANGGSTYCCLQTGRN